MRITTLLLLVASALLANHTANAQTRYQFTFYGTAYQTNSNGVLVATHITDQTLLRSRAIQGGLTNLGTLEMVYHINGNPLGDTVEIIQKDGTYLTTEFGFYFGDDRALGRTVAGSPQSTTGQRRVDPIYTFDDSKYTHSNPDSVGAAFTYKRFVVNAKSVTNAIINGTMSWSVIPTGTNTSPILCEGTFAVGKPLF